MEERKAGGQALTKGLIDICQTWRREWLEDRHEGKDSWWPGIDERIDVLVRQTWRSEWQEDRHGGEDSWWPSIHERIDRCMPDMKERMARGQECRRG